MLLPTNEPVFAGLRTSYIRFDALLSELRTDAHSGFVQVEFPDYRGAILLEGGRIAQAIEAAPEGQAYGPSLANQVEARASRDGGSVSIYRLSPALVRSLASLGSGEPLYRDLSSSFTSLQRLLDKLLADHVNGRVEAKFESSQFGIVFLAEGAVVESILNGAAGLVTGTEAQAAILANSESSEAFFTVYRTVDAVAAPAPARGPAAAVTQPAPAQPPVAATDSAEKEPATIGHADPGVLAAWSEILRRAEGVVDRMGARGAFQEALHEAFLERAVVYPYLDPFADEFSYRDGEAFFFGELPHNFGEALTNSLHDAIARLAFKLKRPDIESAIRAELVDMPARHPIVHAFPPVARALVS